MIQVAYVMNADYFVPLSVSMLSIIKNNNFVHFHILAYRVEQTQINLLRNLCQQHNVEITVYCIDEEIAWIEKNTKTEANWKLTYAKLFIAKLLNGIDRVIYFDTDTVVTCSLEELYSLDLKGCVIGAVDEITSSETKRRIDLEEKQQYFNAGMFLIDINKWNLENISEKCFEYIRKNNGIVHYMDQGTMNHILVGKIYFVEPKYNVTSQMFMKRRGKRFVDFNKGYYTMQQYEEAILNPAVLHYTGMFACHPWTKGCRHVKKDAYLKYLNLLPNDFDKSLKKMSFSYRILSFLYYRLEQKTFDRINFIFSKMRGVKKWLNM